MIHHRSRSQSNEQRIYDHLLASVRANSHQAQIQTLQKFELDLSLYMTDVLKCRARQSQSLIQTVGQPDAGLENDSTGL